MEEEEEEEETLQAKVRSLEQRELRRIRQGAILQRKLEDAEARRRELLGEAQEALQERRKQKAKRERQAVQELEQELHKRLEDLQSKERRLEQDLRVEQKKRKTLEAEVHYWKSCGQILLRRDQAGGKDLASGQDTKATEMQAMELQAAELRSRIKEVERISALGRAQEVDLAARSQTLAHSLGLAESAAKVSKVKVAALRAELLQVESSKPCPSLEEVEEGLGEEEVDYWRRKVEEKTLEVERLGHERVRLKTALQSNHQDVAEFLSTRSCGTLDEMISWFTTSLFKSALMRRAFCAHLVLLYGWIAFLLGWISSRSH